MPCTRVFPAQQRLDPGHLRMAVYLYLVEKPQFAAANGLAQVRLDHGAPHRHRLHHGSKKRSVLRPACFA
nr:hypothetical protein [Halomonas sp. BC04]